jgi:predicted phage terminase large subunit-like protein
VVGVDETNQRAYLTHLARDRGMSVKGIVEWVRSHVDGAAANAPSGGFPIDTLLVEQNAGRGPGQRLKEDTPIPTKNVSSSGSKEQRIHNLSADFESGTLRIVGKPNREPWKDWEQNEWLTFPTSAHDDRLDAIELAMRAVGFGSVPTATASIGGGESTPPGEDVTADSKEFRESEIGSAISEIAERQRGGWP